MATTAKFPLDYALLREVVTSRAGIFSTADIANDGRLVQRYWPPSCHWRYGYYSCVGRWLSEYSADFGLDMLQPRVHGGGGALWFRIPPEMMD